MIHVERINSGVDVAPLLSQIDEHPQLWDSLPYRRCAPGSPHAEMQDIWCRYNDATPFIEKGSFDGFNEPHIPVWYPASHVLPALRPIVFDLMSEVDGEMLGGVLLTRMDRGAVIKPHVDVGWHAKYFNCKVYVILRANESCINRYIEDEVVMRPGECWRFDNSVLHSVENHGPTERIALVVCIRTERFP